MNVVRSSVLAAVGLVVAGGMAAILHSASRHQSEPAKVDFNRDIRPILNANCVACHGGVKEAGGVSFIYRQEALGKGKSGRPTIVPGYPGRSELIARITTSDPETRMPYHASPLPPQQISLLRQWIKEGAEWAEHWAFVPPKHQTLPEVGHPEWTRQPLDRFILARLEREKLNPSPAASKETLLRRLTFDLTGLPPTPEELSSFLSDTSPDAYEKQVDRLLASPAYGERWAALWLDLARYADSAGYESDPYRPVWPYRDWVIKAFNQNIPYDRFVIDQLAGDLLPNPTLEDRIATAFHRLTPINQEGGTDDEEFRMAAVMDRVATTWSVVGGVTMNCVQCHSHPYDPIRHVEYYKSLSLFNSSKDADRPDDFPTIRVPSDDTRQAEVARLEDRSAQLIEQIVSVSKEMTGKSQWTSLPIAQGEANELQGLRWLLEEAEGAKVAETKAELNAKQGSRPRMLQLTAGTAYATGTIPGISAFDLRSGPLPSQAITALQIEVAPIDQEKARHTPEDGFIVDQIRASIVLPNGREQKIRFRYFVPDSEEEAAGNVVNVLTPDAQAHALKSSFSANPKLSRTRWTIGIPETPLALENGSRLKVQLLQTQNINYRPAFVRRVSLKTSDDERWTTFIERSALTQKLGELARVKQQIAAIPGVALPVMAEQPNYERRETLEFERGNFLMKVGRALPPGVPALFSRNSKEVPGDRLAMAQWFFRPDHPLTARVAVNRFWEQVFGTGIVETLEDFGSSGDPPSHPELLDWLALHFETDLRWNVKALLRELVTSATYRQSAAVSPALLKQDPRNRLLARGPQQRLTAEMVRDQALVTSGLLSQTMGGPPVMPPQPAGVWMTVYSDQRWVDATGPDRYRRAIYTYLKRSAMYPSFVTFDLADHIVSTARRTPTNTPLQALVTLNDPVYYEAAQALAKRMKTRASLPERLHEGAQRVLSRDLSPEELASLESLYMDARKLAPASRNPKSKSTAPCADEDFVALTAVASALLNLDDALMR